MIVVLECLGIAMLIADRARAQSEPASEQNVTVATVGDEPIYARDVERLLGKVIGRQEVDPAARPVLQAQVLAEIVDRRLVLAYARRTETGASASEVQRAVTELKSKLAARGRSLSDHLVEQSITEADLRRQIAWKLIWPKYLDRYITQPRLASYFNAHRREFDGTEVSVSHVLLRPEPDAGPHAVAELVERAEELRKSITSGKITFAEAARKHSAGSSADGGGRLGFIARRGAMVEAFSRAAFALEVGRISEPVTTRFGVHLIRCNEIKPGKKELADVRQQLQEALARELIDKLSRLERRYTPVKFTGAGPHFEAGTRKLAVP